MATGTIGSIQNVALKDGRVLNCQVIEAGDGYELRWVEPGRGVVTEWVLSADVDHMAPMPFPATR